MNILQINTCHYPRGGSETVYFNTSQILKEHGHNVGYFSAKNHRNLETEFERFFIPFVNIRELSIVEKIEQIPDYLYNRTAIRNLEDLLKYFKPDIAHVHLFYGVLSVSILKTLKKHKIPVVHTVHDYRLLCPAKTFMTIHNQICESCRGKKYFNCLKKGCSEGKISQSGLLMLEAYYWRFFVDPLDYIDHVIFVSKFIQQKHIEFDSRYKEKNSHLYNFTFTQENSATSTKGDYFFFYGRLSPEKGLKVLLETFAQTNSKLKIAGSGPLKDYVLSFANRNSNIEYLGFQTGDTLKSLIKNSSFVIVPSIWYENNPMTVIEAFSFGKPVIGAEIGGIPELIQHGKNGYLFTQNDRTSLQNIIEKASQISNEEYRQFSMDSVRFANEHFDPEKHYTELINIYQNTIQKSSDSNVHK
jgi:glycosyltransferase involved in cell wall biosynthesis